MAGRVYTALFNEVAASAQQDFFEILAASGKLVEILEWGLSQSTHEGDAGEEQLHLLEKRGIGTVTSGTGGGSATVNPVDDGDTAAGVTAEINNTTKMATGTGSIENIGTYNWNTRIPYRHAYLDPDRPVIAPGNRWALELATTPEVAATVSGYVRFMEKGS